MNNLLALNVNSTAGIFLILLIVVGIALLVAEIYAWITKIIVAHTYRKNNKIGTNLGLNAMDNTKFMLEAKGLNDIQVKKVGFFRAIFGLGMQGWGNSYSHYKKTIFLRKNIIDKATITSTAVSSQRVGQAVLDKNGDKDMTFVVKYRPVIFLAPILVLPIILLFSILDLSVFKTDGILSIIGVAITFVYMVVSIVLLAKTIPAEKKANKVAMEILRNSKQYSEEELDGMQKVLDVYIKSYVADYIYAIIEFVWEILKLAFKFASKEN